MKKIIYVTVTDFFFFVDNAELSKIFKAYFTCGLKNFNATCGSHISTVKYYYRK